MFFISIIQNSSIFSGNPFRTNEFGTLRAVTGPMKSAKTEALIRYALLLQISKGIKLCIFKPGIDSRKLDSLEAEQDPTKFLSSRGIKNTVPCIPVTTIDEMRKIVQQQNPSHIIIDEINFFEEKTEFVEFMKELLNQKKQIILGGLDLDFRAQTFEPMGDVLALANHIEKSTAVCDICGHNNACRTQRLINGEPAKHDDALIIVDGSGSSVVYQARCSHCYQPPK